MTYTLNKGKLSVLCYFSAFMFHPQGGSEGQTRNAEQSLKQSLTGHWEMKCPPHNWESLLIAVFLLGEEPSQGICASQWGSVCHTPPQLPHRPCVTEWQDHRKPWDKPSESWSTNLPKIWKRIGVNVLHPHSCPSDPLVTTSVSSKCKSDPSCFHLSPLLPFGYQPTWSTPSSGSHLILGPSPCLCSCLTVLLSVSQTPRCLPCLGPLLLRFLLWTTFYTCPGWLRLILQLFKCHFLKETFPNLLIRSDAPVICT